MFVRYIRDPLAGGVQAGRDARHQGRAQPCQQQAALSGRHRLEALNIAREKSKNLARYYRYCLFDDLCMRGQ
jgi:hypothetical protein